MIMSKALSESAAIASVNALMLEVCWMHLKTGVTPLSCARAEREGVSYCLVATKQIGTTMRLYSGDGTVRGESICV